MPSPRLRCSLFLSVCRNDRDVNYYHNNELVVGNVDVVGDFYDDDHVVINLLKQSWWGSCCWRWWWSNSNQHNNDIVKENDDVGVDK